MPPDADPFHAVGDDLEVAGAAHLGGGLDVGVVVDHERGLVVAFAFFDHDAGKSRTFKTPDGREVVGGPVQPWTWMIAELFKVEGGLLHEIEAILERVPYGMPSGWSSWEDGMSDKIQFPIR